MAIEDGSYRSLVGHHNIEALNVSEVITFTEGEVIGEEMTKYVKFTSTATLVLQSRVGLVILDKLAIVLEDHNNGAVCGIGHHRHPKRPTCPSFVSGCDLIVVFDDALEMYASFQHLGDVNFPDDKSSEVLCVFGHYSTTTNFAVSSSLVTIGRSRLFGYVLLTGPIVLSLSLSV